MPTALSLEKRPFVLECDRALPPEQQTTFHIRPLTARERANLQDRVKFREDGKPIKVKIKDVDRELYLPENQNELICDKVARGLVGWENFKDETGQPVAFVPDGDNLSRLETLWLIELANAIDELSTLPEAAEKN